MNRPTALVLAIILCSSLVSPLAVRNGLERRPKRAPFANMLDAGWQISSERSRRRTHRFSLSDSTHLRRHAMPAIGPSRHRPYHVHRPTVRSVPIGAPPDTGPVP